MNYDSMTGHDKYSITESHYHRTINNITHTCQTHAGMVYSEDNAQGQLKQHLLTCDTARNQPCQPSSTMDFSCPELR